MRMVQLIGQWAVTIETYKILPGVYDRDVGHKLPKGNSATRGHSKNIIKRGSRLNIRKYLFTLRVAAMLQAPQGYVWSQCKEHPSLQKHPGQTSKEPPKQKFNCLHSPYSNPCWHHLPQTSQYILNTFSRETIVVWNTLTGWVDTTEELTQQTVNCSNKAN